MLGRFLKREKSRVFLGTVAVMPRKDIKRFLDQSGMLRDEKLDTSLHTTLQEIFKLPHVSEVVAPTAGDLGLDILISSFQSGDYWDVSLGVIDFPIFWRPKVTVVSRLYYLASTKTKHIVSVTQKLSWREFLSRLFTWRTFLRLQPMFDAKDMDRLLYLACHKVLNKLRKAA